MKYRRWMLPLVAALCCAAARVMATPQGQDHQAVLADVLALAQQRALNTARVDWPATHAAARQMLQQNNTDAGLSAAIGHVLAQLEDRHSFYRPPVARTNSARSGSGSGPEAIATLTRSPGGSPLLRIHAWAGADMAQATERVRSSLVQGLADGSCGIVLDFSSNNGGNMWPMLMGLLPLYTPGPLGGFRYRDGLTTTITATGSGLQNNGRDHPLNAITLPQPAHRPAQVAVITGKRTASSGEIITLLFRGQPNVRTFGQATAGVPTANQTFTLKNGGLLAMTTAETMDRNGRGYRDSLIPDVLTEAPVQAADQWIARTCAATPAP